MTPGLSRGHIESHVILAKPDVNGGSRAFAAPKADRDSCTSDRARGANHLGAVDPF